MAIERTLVIIKPDAVMMGYTDQIRQRYLDAGLNIQAEFDVQLLEPEASLLYAEHSGRPYFAGLVLAMTSGDVIALILEGESAVSKVRELNGATKPSEAKPGTIRHDFPSAGGPFNVVHASDSVENVAREIAIMEVAKMFG